MFFTFPRGEGVATAGGDGRGMRAATYKFRKYIGIFYALFCRHSSPDLALLGHPPPGGGFFCANSNDKNILTIKNTLNTWGDITGLNQKFTREASRINYKKAIFYYFILSIQYYNH